VYERSETEPTIRIKKNRPTYGRNDNQNRYNSEESYQRFNALPTFEKTNSPYYDKRPVNYRHQETSPPTFERTEAGPHYIKRSKSYPIHGTIDDSPYYERTGGPSDSYDRTLSNSFDNNDQIPTFHVTVQDIGESKSIKYFRI
jgi:hypothetical protein